MNKILHYLSVSLLLIFALSACSDSDQDPMDSPYGSYRDWNYKENQFEFYIDGVEQPQVKEIYVKSNPIHGDELVFPWYKTTLRVKGLVGKNKVFDIEVLSDIDRFEGTTTLNGIEYDVTGVFTGSPFDHYTNQGIIVNLNKK